MKMIENGIQSLLKFLLCFILFGGLTMSIEAKPKEEVAIFAGGCFWCTQAAFDNTPGVIEVSSGYTGGTVPNPTYEQVCTGKTGHFEGIQIRFDPTKTTFEKLLTIFWNNIDPTDAGGQYADRGTQYLTAIFYTNPSQKMTAEHSKKALALQLKKPVATAILPAKPFYKAEDYHQNYHTKNPLRYQMYKQGSGRG
jgi:peptide methionine sulfoxide reductase msrA/msrB